MRKLSFTAALLALAACGAPQRADLTLDWTFDGGRTCAQAGVAIIQVDVEGEILNPNRFACQAGSGTVNTGAYLGSFLLGTYNVTVSGLDGASNVVYRASKSVQVKVGGTRDALDAPAGSATLRWTFGGKSCAATGVSVVRVSVDGQSLLDEANNPDLPCSQRSVDGITVGPLTAGTHTFDLTGYVNGQVAYNLQGYGVTVALAKDTAVAPDLAVAAPTTGTADLRWTFVGMTCAEAKVDVVRVFFDPAADGSGGQDLGPGACSTGGVDGLAFDGVPPGTHSFSITGVRRTASGDALVYTTRVPASGPFQVGATTKLELSADTTPPGKGGVALTWQFPAGGSCGGASSVSYTLTDPTGHSYAPQTAGCGGGSANGIDFCWTGSSTASCPGIMAGLWTINATAGSKSARNAFFAVPNDEHGAATIQFQ